VQRSAGAAFRLSAYPERVFPLLGPSEGRPPSIGAVVDPDSRTLSVRYEASNPGGLLRLGMFADVMIEIDRRRDVLVAPIEAIVDDSGEPVVYVQREGESFARRPVELGIRDGDLMEIRGLAAGERLVTRGAYTIRLSTLSGAIPEHHHHH
jgi:multidrug efflux pump subunit AcrA (membrane-fusion protein)